MAKVTMPLLSGTASGKIAGSMVHFGWKGRAIVRQLVTPSNPKTGGQGNQRLILGTAGKALKAVAENSEIISDARAYAPGGQTWISALASYISKNVLVDASTFDSVHGDYAAHAQKAQFDTEAGLLGMVAFDISYKTASSSAEAGFQLYVLAKALVDIHAADSTQFNRAPITTALASWSGANVTTFKGLLLP